MLDPIRRMPARMTIREGGTEVRTSVDPPGPSASSQRRVALVTDGDRTTAAAITVALGRAGWDVVVLGPQEEAIATRSRYVCAHVVPPDPRTEPREFVDAVLDAVREHGVRFVLPVTDDALFPMAADRARLERACAVALPPEEGLAIVRDKGRTGDLARSLGIETPRERRFRVGDLRRLDSLAPLDELGWPLVVKPVSSRHDTATGILAPREVTYARDRESLLRRLEPFEPGEEVLLQEHCPGRGVGLSFLCRDGRPLLAFQHERIAEVPITGGASAVRTSVPLDSDLFDASVRLLRALDWTGLAMVEFKVGERPVLMEVNGRVWGSLPLALHAGVDFPSALAALTLDGSEPGGALGEYELGVCRYNPELLLPFAGNGLLGRTPHPELPRPTRRGSLAVLASTLRGDVASDLAFPEDPGPARAMRRHLWRKLWKKVFKQVRLS